MAPHRRMTLEKGPKQRLHFLCKRQTTMRSSHMITHAEASTIAHVDICFFLARATTSHVRFLQHVESLGAAPICASGFRFRGLLRRMLPPTYHGEHRAHAGPGRPDQLQACRLGRAAAGPSAWRRVSRYGVGILIKCVQQMWFRLGRATGLVARPR